VRLRTQRCISLLLARRRDRRELVAPSARALGAAEVEVHQADVTRDGDVAHEVAGLQVRGIGLDIVYANAGFGVAGPMQSLMVAGYQRQLDTNVVGLLRTVYETLSTLRAARGRLGSCCWAASPAISPHRTLRPIA
jgi:NADP-dependent 3-hydroxy acid dehydrogenase YdfG